MTNYGKLNPGVYLQHGDSVKSLEILRSEIFDLGSKSAPVDVDTLAAQVSWVYIALSLRKERILEVPMSWRKSGELVSGPDVEFKMRGLLPRIDEAIQLYGRAYLYKLRNANGNFAGVRWVDPLTITPEVDSGFRRPEQVNWYTRELSGRDDMDIPAKDIIDITVRGQRELVPAPAAAAATSLAAQIVHGMQSAQDNVYDNNAIPPVLINVPQNIDEQEKLRLQSFWRRLYNRDRGSDGGQRVVAVRDGVTVQQVELDFSKLLMTEIEESQVLSILNAHGVHDAIGRADASANRSTREEATRNFIATLGARAEFIAEIINDDPDMIALDLELNFQVNEHWSQKRDEELAAKTFATYLGGMQPEAAAHIVGIRADDFPEAMRDRIFLTGPVESTVESPESRSEPNKAMDYDLDKYRRKALKRLGAGRSASVDFVSENIPSSLLSAVDRMLKSADTKGRVNAVFSDAHRWQSYP